MTPDRALVDSDPVVLGRHVGRIRRLLHGHGATFQIHGDGRQEWELDPIPIVVPEVAWKRLADGLEQRGRAIDLLLADLTGDQQLIRRGLVPYHAVLAHSGYLRPCRGVVPPAGRSLVSYAADVIGTDGGGFLVLADRTQEAAGSGYALENRAVMLQARGDDFRRVGVAGLSSWFEHYRSALASLAPAGTDEPRVVILTPGQDATTYFEHSYLAQALGLTLVEPGDLTVRGGRVWLKSVSGLEPVHVVVRRVAGAWCDTLELHPYSPFGIPGLVEACRRATVSLANPLGSGLAESPVFLPVVERVIREVLGEQPALASVATWWCGTSDGLSHVLANLDRLVIKHIDAPPRSSVFGRLASRAELAQLAERIRADPHLYVGQEEAELPTVAAFDGVGITERHAVLRCFLVAEGDGYQAMAGGLGRTAATPDRVRMSTGGVAKDIWVQTSTRRRRPAPVRIRLPQVDLRASTPSRAAENMYWLGRNLERCEAVVRMVRAVERGFVTRSAVPPGTGWFDTLAAAVEWCIGPAQPGADGHTPDVAGTESTPHAKTVVVPEDEREPSPPDPVRQDLTLNHLLERALTDRRHPRSLATSLHFLVHNAGAVRDLFSTETWRMLTQLGDLQRRLSHPDPAGDSTGPLDLTSETLGLLAGVSGMMAESMVRDPGWQFLDVGRRLERAILVSGTLAALCGERADPEAEPSLLEATLGTWESLVAYRRRHRSDIELPATLALLLCDPSNPRSLAFSLDALVADLRSLPAGTDRLAAAVATAEGLVSTVAGLRTKALARSDESGRRSALVQLMARFDTELRVVSDAIELGFFAHIDQRALLAARTRSYPQ